jgi:hypothetical protein
MNNPGRIAANLPEEGATSPIVDASATPIAPEEILVLRRGPGANCSSIGSALDVLFLSATLAGVILVSVASAMGQPKDLPPRRGAAADAEADEDEASDAGTG